MERLEAIVYGRVQGVMYRDFTCRKARGLRLTGAVQNLPDGTVRVVAEGKRGDLEQLLSRLNHGPLFANVERVDSTWSKATGDLGSFAICYK